MAASISQLRSVIDALLKENADQKEQIARLSSNLEVLKEAVMISASPDTPDVVRRGPGRPRKA